MANERHVEWANHSFAESAITHSSSEWISWFISHLEFFSISTNYHDPVLKQTEVFTHYHLEGLQCWPGHLGNQGKDEVLSMRRLQFCHSQKTETRLGRLSSSGPRVLRHHGRTIMFSCPSLFKNKFRSVTTLLENTTSYYQRKRKLHRNLLNGINIRGNRSQKKTDFSFFKK